jgi:ABC-type glycerol-3-phosphate transport system permease component
MKKAIFYLVLVFGALMFLYPFMWMITATLVPESDISDLTVMPSSISFNSYVQMFDKIPIGRALLNSIFVASSITIGVLVFGSIVGYALSRLDFKGRNLIFFIIIFTMTLPIPDNFDSTIHHHG